MVQYVAKSAVAQGRVDAAEATLAGQHAANLWQEWQAGKDPALREQLIQFYLPLARMLAGSLYRKRSWLELEYMDYYQYATLGLIEAIDRFDPKRGVSFGTWAGVRISGAVLNGIESLSEKQAQVSARQRIVNSRIESLRRAAIANQAVGHEAGHEAGHELAEYDAAGQGSRHDEYAADLATEPVQGDEPVQDEDVFAKLAELAIGLAVGFALEETGMIEPEQEPHYPDNAYQRLEMAQLRQQLQQQLVQLPDNENRVLNYHYLQQLGFDEIGQILQLSKGRISQLHRQGLNQLKGRLNGSSLLDFHI